MPSDSFRQDIAALIAQHSAAARATAHSARSEVFESATAEVERVAERERYRLRQELQELERARDNALETLERRTEEQRQACAAALLEEAFDSSATSSLPTLIGKWRSEPTRQLTIAIRERWAELDARAVEQLGIGLGRHVVAAAFIDSIVASTPAALVYLSAPNYSNQKVVESLGTFVRSEGPVGAEAALGQLESQLMTAGRRGAGQPVEQLHLERHALRKTCATHGDLVRAQAALEQSVERARLAKLAAEHVLPPGSYCGPSDGYVTSPPAAAAGAPPVLPLDRPLLGYPG